MNLTITGSAVELDDRHAKRPLLWVLRDALEMHGTKFGCGVGYRAASTVLLDGKNTHV
jgi:aerobic-type carbon monoxide dehydrogenase small subunit (CoxS/CutS family)